MPVFKGLLSKAWASIANPGQDERVAVLIAAIDRGFRTQKNAFDLDAVVAPIDCTHTDLKVACTEYYSGLVRRFWQDGIPDKARVGTLSLVASKLKLDSRKVKETDVEAAVAFFGATLSTALSDRSLTEAEYAKLNEIAAVVDCDVPSFVRQHMASQSLGLLRSLFAEAVSTGMLREQLWVNLVDCSERLGIRQSELTASARKLAQGFAEHVLADTKSDGALSAEEDGYLQWLRVTFEFDKKFDSYLADEIGILREKTGMASGVMPTIDAPQGVNLKSGELLYLCQASTLKSVKNSRSIRLLCG